VRKQADAVAEVTRERDEYLYASVQWMERARNVERERDEALAEVERLNALLPQAFDAGFAYAIDTNCGFYQTHPDREEWLARNAGTCVTTRKQENNP
jgi:hypothetical protein